MSAEYSKARARQLLTRRFGHTDSQPGQWAPIDAVLSGHDALVVMPTGSGKSLVYQLPALMLHGLAVVVSPFIARMQDQQDRLAARGVDALATHEPKVTITGFARPDLRFEVRRTVNAAEKDQARRAMLRRGDGVGVVRVATVREADRLHEMLRQELPVGIHHGRMTGHERKELQHRVMADEFRAII